MEYMETIISKINNYMEREANFDSRQENQIELTFIRLNGLSNTVYLVKVFDKTSKTLLKELIYRKFGEISELVDRNTEMEIIDSLSSKSFTPKILETDGTSYRIEEYIGNSDVLPRILINEDFIIEKMINLLVSYSLITSIYNFTLISDSLSKEYQISFDPQFQEIKRQNIFDKCTVLMYNKAKVNFEIFMDKLGKKYDNLICEEVMEKIFKIKSYMENYKDLFAKVLPKKGIATVCHNDVHRLNLLLTEDNSKIIVLDHEYACLNIAGVDIVNYMIETKFDYTKKAFPFYEFERDSLEIDFARFYEVFLKFMQRFEEEHSIDADKEYFTRFQKCKTPKYFHRIVCVISLFWIVYSVMYLDYDDFVEKNKFDMLNHAIDRIFIFEKAYAALENLKKEVNEEAVIIDSGLFID